MTIELTVLAWGCVLALVLVFAAVMVKTAQYGPKWNMGPRDEVLPPPNPLVGRLARAQANFFETFPVMIAAILIIHAAGLANVWTGWGAMLWLGVDAPFEYSSSRYWPVARLRLPAVPL